MWIFYGWTHLRRYFLPFKGATSTTLVRVHEMKATAELELPETSGTIRLGVL